MGRTRSVIGALIVVATILVVAVFALLRSDATLDSNVIRVGVLPSDRNAKLEQRYSPLLVHLGHETGWRFKLVNVDSYEHLLERFKNREVDLAHFGGLTFIQAYSLYAPSPLVMRDEDRRTTTYAVVKKGGALQNCRNLKCRELANTKLAFGPLLSTSGHLMPRHFLQTKIGITPENFFSEVAYSRGHRATAYGVRDGHADIGMINAGTYKSMLRGGELAEDDLQVVWETPPYPDSVWAVQSDMPESAKIKLRDAFLSLDITRADHARTLAAMFATSYMPAAVADFEPLIKIAQALDLMTTPEEP